MDRYDYFRRLMIDVCKRLPTIDEIEQVQSLSLCPADFVDYAIEQCIDGEELAETIALWVDDFMLPSSYPTPASGKWLMKDTWTGTVDDVPTSITFFHPPHLWDGCGAADGAALTAATFADAFELVDRPYWDMQGSVYVCKLAGAYPAWWTGSTPTYASVGGTEDPTISGVDHYCMVQPQFPCGCGPNLAWCNLESLTTGSDDNTNGSTMLAQQVKAEVSQLVRYVVQNDLPFTDVFDADYAVRTTRLAHAYEQNNRVDLSNRCIKNDDNTVPLPTAHETIYLTAKTPSSDNWCGTRTERFEEGSYSTDVDDYDWQVMDTPGYQSGIITSYELLLRQPTEPNIANQIYRFWTCDEITWRDRDFDSTVPSIDGIAFSPLVSTTRANEPLLPPKGPQETCEGCHYTLNPLAAFRNGWNIYGRYDATASATGIFLGTSGSGLDGLGALLAASPEVHRCIVKRTYRVLVGEELTDPDTLDTLTASFEAVSPEFGHERSIKQLYRDILELPEYRRGL
jgi:hypothetical protein